MTATNELAREPENPAWRLLVTQFGTVQYRAAVVDQLFAVACCRAGPVRSSGDQQAGEANDGAELARGDENHPKVVQRSECLRDFTQIFRACPSGVPAHAESHLLSDVTLGIHMNASKPVLVAYYSSTGNTARVAHDLAERLGADIESIQDRRHRAGLLGRFTAAVDAWREAPGRIEPLRHNPADYAITIVGTPVWTAKMTPAVRAYLRETRGRIQSAAFFVTSGDTDIGKLLSSLESAAGRTSVASAGFNAKELRDAAIYERKLSALVDQVTRAVQLSRRAA